MKTRFSVILICALLVTIFVGNPAQAAPQPSNDTPITVEQPKPAEQCSQSGENGTSICTEPIDGPPAPELAHASSVMPLPLDLCNSSKPGATKINETASCSYATFKSVVRNVRNGKKAEVIATAEYSVYLYQLSLLDDTKMANQLTVIPFKTTGSGDRIFFFGARPNCKGNCSLVSDTAKSGMVGKRLIKNQSVSGESYYKWTGKKERTAQGMGWSFSLKHPHAPEVVEFHIPPAVSYNCDNVAQNARAGCKVKEFVSWVLFSKQDFPNFAKHVLAAQRSGLPGDQIPLHRLKAGQSPDKNRAKACPRSLPSIKGLSCDEYPFASAQEGAEYGGPGVARTFDFCKISDLRYALNGVGRKGYSACMIPGPENSLAGTRTGQFYASHHILAGDPFTIGFN